MPQGESVLRWLLSSLKCGSDFRPPLHALCSSYRKHIDNDPSRRGRIRVSCYVGRHFRREVCYVHASSNYPLGFLSLIATLYGNEHTGLRIVELSTTVFSFFRFCQRLGVATTLIRVSSLYGHFVRVNTCCQRWSRRTSLTRRAEFVVHQVLYRMRSVLYMSARGGVHLHRVCDVCARPICCVNGS